MTTPLTYRYKIEREDSEMVIESNVRYFIVGNIIQTRVTRSQVVNTYHNSETPQRLYLWRQYGQFFGRWERVFQ